MLDTLYEAGRLLYRVGSPLQDLPPDIRREVNMLRFRVENLCLQIETMGDEPIE